MTVPVYTAQQISRWTSSSIMVTDWGIVLAGGREGRVQLLATAYHRIEAADQDAYACEALAAYLNRHEVPEDLLLARTLVVADLAA